MRPIDATPLEKRLFPMADRALAKNPYEKARICAYRRAFEMVLNAPTITPPSNRPLTLDELRDLDGEPVWVADLLIPDCSCYHFTQKIDGHVLLMEPRYYPAKDVMIPHYCADDENQGYGQTWLAYRRKPEGSQ